MRSILRKSLIAMLFPFLTSYIDKKDFDKYHIESGINLTCFKGKNFDEIDKKAIDRLIENGFYSVVANRVYFQDNLNSSNIFNTSNFSEKHLESLFSSYNFNKTLRILINTKTDESRTLINPSDINLWYKYYYNIIKENLELANKNNIEKFDIVSELDNLLISHPKLFKDLALNIKNIYNKDIGISVTFTNDEDLKKIILLNDFPIDFIGLDFYVSMENDSLKDKFFEPLYYLKRINEYSKKEIIIMELGYRSVNKGNKKPMFNYKIQDYKDDKIQKESYENFFKALLSKELGNNKIKGINLWVTDNNFYYEDILNSNSTGYSIFNKEAENVIKKFNKDRLYYFLKKKL